MQRNKPRIGPCAANPGQQHALRSAMVTHGDCNQGRTVANPPAFFIALTGQSEASGALQIRRRIGRTAGSVIASHTRLPRGRTLSISGG